jgi:hypothetical protein
MTNQKKLPIISTFIQVLRVIKDRYKSFFSFSIPIFIFFGMTYIFQTSLFPSSLPNAPEPSELLEFIFWLLGIFTISMVTVAFHRVFIMDLDDVSQTKIFRLGLREWRFIGWYFAISFFIGIIMYVILFSLGGFIRQDDMEMSQIVLLSAMIPIAYLSSRWLLVLPAASVDDEEASLSFAWNLSAGNGWRLTTLIVAIPASIKFLSSYLLLVNNMLTNIISIVFSILTLLIGVGVISLSYAYLKNKRSELLRKANKLNTEQVSQKEITDNG